ncbi:MAG TPA: molybdenum ABC transporter ATP-binding protein [Burkholderiales bacterium]|nr:molybdenum ABC transporter ATP-binding protein [Burkholderiales bacterium]
MLRVDVERDLGAFRMRVSFETHGRVTALFGRSGSGKTSLVNAIAGLTRPDRGRIEIDAQVLFDSAGGIDRPVERRRLGYVFQEARLFPHYSVRRNLMYGRDLAPPAERYVDFDHIVELLGLAHLLARRPGELSGGEKQRVAIGRALLSQPRALLLDEPLASLDAQRKDEILGYIERMRDDVRIPIVYVSHAVEEVVRLADWVVVMSAGAVAAAGTVEEVMGRTDLGAAADVFEGGSVIDARVVAQDPAYDIATLAFEGGTLVATHTGAAVGEPVRVRIRARDVSLALEAPRSISIQNVLRGRIAAVRTLRKGVVDVAVAVGAVTLRSSVTQRAADQLALEMGQPVFALVKAVSLDRRAVPYAG